jgi:hypothetical protein
MVSFNDASKDVYGAQGVIIVNLAKTWLSFCPEPHASESWTLATAPMGKQ